MRAFVTRATYDLAQKSLAALNEAGIAAEE